MAKKVILDVLESTIGKYVKNLDAESLNVAVWSGKIELHALELNIDAVNAELDRQAAQAPNLAFPFRVTGGKFKSFEVDVPWARISSRPVVLRAKGLEVYVEPYDRLSKLDQLTSKGSDENATIQKAKDTRARSIKAEDDFRKQSNALRKLASIEDGEKGMKNEKNESSFGGRLVRRVAENLQVEIDDVHIALKGCDSAAGVVLASLSLVTTDKNGVRTFVDRTIEAKSSESSFLYKALSIKGLGIYLDEVKAGMSRPFTIVESRADPGTKKNFDHSFILAPLSFEANLRQSDDAHCIDFPKYLLTSKLSQLSILLSRNQLELGQKISHAITSSDRVNPLFPEYRPLSRVSKDTAKEWWMYAIRCIGRMSGRRSWVEFFLAFQKRRRYVALYKRAAHSSLCSWLTSLSDSEQSELALLEEDKSVSVKGIMAWRNVADAQVDLENEKHAASKRKVEKRVGMMSFFGSAGKSLSNVDDESPPIVLTAEELRELESIGLEQATDVELSNDSRLCDFKFVLGSLKVNLSTYAMTPLASLALGLVTTSFDANVDGSFNFNLKLSSVLVHDSVTPNSLYRTILRNLPPTEGLLTNDNSFVVKLSKSTSGNRDLALRMVAFELVASPMLVIEMKHFFSLSQRPSNTALAQKNPILAQSISGSVDLFYDADEGDNGKAGLHSAEHIFSTEKDAAAVDKVSSTLLAAWRSKLDDKKVFTVDCDIHAPIIIVPEDCVKQDAIALVFDLGHLRFQVGRTDVAQKVQQWMQSNTIATIEGQVDHGSLFLENLTFSVLTTKEILSNTTIGQGARMFRTIVDPLSLLLDFGIETSIDIALPRICAFGVFPSVAMRVSPFQLSNISVVAQKWKWVSDRLNHKGDSGSTNISVAIMKEKTGPYVGHDSTPFPHRATHSIRSSIDIEKNQKQETASLLATATKLFVSVSLQRLSVYCHLDDGDGVEAHLVSVSACSATGFDGRICNRLQMGWFWILDRIKSDLPRSQRLLAHSNLPISATALAVNDEYDIFGELHKLNVFSDKYMGSNELADISVVIAAEDRMVSIEDIFHGEQPLENLDAVDLVVDMRLTSLFVNWNPSALKAMVQACSDAFKWDDFIKQNNPTIIVPVSTASGGEKSKTINSQSSVILHAKLEHFEVSLNSARDDLPLYVLSMSGTRVSFLSCQLVNQEILAALELGDLRIATPTISSTKATYTSLLGLAPSHSTSLLSIQYFVGIRPLASAIIDQNISNAKLEALAIVKLSPMRLVYIQAQVSTLIEYVNDGILGALTARAALTAANAAKDIVATDAREKLFVIRGVGFDLILPQAADSENYFVVHAGDLSINHRTFPAPGGGATDLSLSEVFMHDGLRERMIDKPIMLVVKVDLPSDTSGSELESTILAQIQISEASFLLTKGQYHQVMLTLACNISETDPFLREVFDPRLVTVAVHEEGKKETSRQITHAGLAIVERTSRISVDLRIELLSLEVFQTGFADPLAKISASKSRITMKLIPDQEQMMSEIMLHNLICEDRRLKSTNRQFKNLISQVQSDHTSSDDLFFISYANNKRQRKTAISLKIGSPQFVLIPDSISEILSFLKVDGSKEKIQSASNQPEEWIGEDVKVEIDTNAQSIDKTVGVMTKTMTLSLVTADCGIVLVDMGSTALEDASVSRSLAAKGYQTRATESIVLQGKFEAGLILETELASEKNERVALDFHGSRVQVYTAYGRELSNPLQMVEPTSYSVFFNIDPKPGSAAEVDVRAVTLEPLEVTFSMQNAALLKAISSSISGSLAEAQALESRPVSITPLSADETKRIEDLVSALSRTDSAGNDDSCSEVPPTTDESSHHSKFSTNKIDFKSLQWKLRMTLPVINVTVVNDLQGLDDALFRLCISNLVTGTEGTNGSVLGKPQIVFNFHMNASLAADYFDSSVHQWKKLLKKPWEITLNSTRGVSKRFQSSSRLSTNVDLESCPCHVSFSEQFLVNLNAANRMWSIYSRATRLATGVDVGSDDESIHSVAKEALAANAARNLVISLPYAVENHSGIDALFSTGQSLEGEKVMMSCPTGTVQSFRFDAPRGCGYGGRRLYGQDILQLKALSVYIGDATIEIAHIDSEIGRKRRAHYVGGGRVILAHVTRDGKSTVLHLSSQVEMHNDTSIPFHISVATDLESYGVGICGGRSVDSNRNSSWQSTIPLHEGGASRKTKMFGIPIHLLHSFQSEQDGDRANKQLCLQISPQLPGLQRPLIGKFDIPSCKSLQRYANTEQCPSIFDVICRSDMSSVGNDYYERAQDPFVLQLRMKVTTISENIPFIEIFMKPRATIENKSPIFLSLRTPMPYTYALSHDKKRTRSDKASQEGRNEIIHEVAPNDGIEIFSPSASLAIGIKCSDLPVGGGITGWMKGDWVDLPMVPEFRLPEPLRCMFPFAASQRNGVEGSEFFIVEAGDDLSEVSLEQRAEPITGITTKYSPGRDDSVDGLAPTHADVDAMRSYHVTVCNYGIDHTGGILFEQVVLGNRQLRGSTTLDSSVFKRSLSIPTLTPFSAFASTTKLARISLLPGSSVPLRILHLTMDGQDGLRRSLPFRIDDVSICDGGINSTPLLWEDNSVSGFFAYRQLVGSVSYQSEIHIIPEFIIYNGSKNRAVLIRQQGGHGPTTEIFLEPGKTAPLRRVGKSGLVLSFLYVEVGGVTPWMRMDDLSHKVVMIRSMDNFPIGSLACQTVIGSIDSKLVIKLGELQPGASTSELTDKTYLAGNPFADDFLRLRVKWSELRVTLNEATSSNEYDRGSGRAIIESTMDQVLARTPESANKRTQQTWVDARRDRSQQSEGGAIDDCNQAPVCTIVFSRFTIDWQKVFKEENVYTSTQGALLSPERSQLSMIIHHLLILDETPLALYPTVFDSTSSISFFDLCVRFRGSLDADLVKVDLVDLNLAHVNGKSERILLTTSEDFVWKVLDVVNRIIVATGELAGIDIHLDWDEEEGEFIVKMEAINEQDSHDYSGAIYTPPKSNTLFDVNKLRISPFTIVVSFKRQPHATRYKKMRNMKGARLMNYFTTKLKFTLDRAELAFSRYEELNLKGPADKLFEVMAAVYMSRMKLKIVTILSAVSFQDWKSLASREGGDDSYQEGDIARVTGNLAGKSADAVFNKVGHGLGNGLSSMTSRLGDEIENATGKVGAKSFGIGVNSVVTGIGDGVGDTLKGVGSGTGKVLKGAGQGIGHVFGGVTGAVLLAGKGIGKGVTKGDGQAVLDGFTGGAKSIGKGLGKGVNTTVTGTADGVLAVGHGVWSGAKNIGKGFGGAVFGSKKPEPKR